MSLPIAPLATLKKRQANSFGAVKLARQGVDPFLASLFASRGIRDVSDIYPDLTEILPIADLKNCAEMASILADCVVSQKRVLIVSDYDCDGATACSILVCAFEAAGLNFGYLVPDRMTHGYGLTPSIVEEAASLYPRPDIIITVDNGISSTAGVDRANELGIDVLVTDHHLAPDVLPKARLIVNPNQPGCGFGSKNIAGCGVAWYVAKALTEEISDRDMRNTFDAYALLPFVAIGTVADVVQLDRNNRILVREGLERIRAGQCSIGIQLLTATCSKVLHTLSCSDIGFGLAPRINAAGRLSHMSGGIECLTTRDHAIATAMAKKLNGINEERKEIQKEIVQAAFEQALATLPASGNALSFVVYEPQWHEGVVGVVAGRLKEDKHRPVIVMCDSQDGDIKGSGRSIPGFHLKHALDKINARFPGVLVKFGGHAMAAGLTIKHDKLAEFRKAFDLVCAEDIAPAMLEKVLEHDGKMPPSELNLDAVRRMGLEIWGQGFPEPVFVDEFDIVSHTVMGKEKEHLKLMVKVGYQEVPLLAFGHGERSTSLPRRIVTAFKAQINPFRGQETIQFLGENLDFDSFEPALVIAPTRYASTPTSAASPSPLKKNRFIRA